MQRNYGKVFHAERRSHKRYSDDEKRYSAAVGVVGYTTVHSSEEMQRFNAILNDEDLLCFDDTYKNPEHLQKKAWNPLKKNIEPVQR